MKIIAHRGAVSHYSENTLEGILKAIELPFDGVELDVRATKDGRLILMHDATINRTTDGKGRVSMLSTKQLSAIRTKDGRTIPTLNTVMQRLAKTDKLINIEMKSYGCAEQVAEYAKQPNVYVSSPLRTELEKTMELEPSGRYGLVLSNPAKLLIAARSRRYHFLTIHRSLINAKVVRYLYKLRQPVWVYTAKSEEDIRRWRDLAVHAVFSDIEPPR